MKKKAFNVAMCAAVATMMVASASTVMAAAGTNYGTTIGGTKNYHI